MHFNLRHKAFISKRISSDMAHHPNHVLMLLMTCLLHPDSLLWWSPPLCFSNREILEGRCCNSQAFSTMSFLFSWDLREAFWKYQNSFDRSSLFSLSLCWSLIRKTGHLSFYCERWDWIGNRNPITPAETSVRVVQPYIWLAVWWAYESKVVIKTGLIYLPFVYVSNCSPF